MRELDLTDRIEKRKGSRVTYSTVYVSGRYVGFASNSIGISFIRRAKNGKISRWYFGSSNTLQKAAAEVRQNYGIKLPVHNWDKIRIKTYNTTQTDEVVQNLIK